MPLRFVFFLSLLGVTAAASAEPARQPTAKWNVNFADAQCLALRPYGSAEQPLHLVLKAPAVGGVMQIAVLRKGGETSPNQVDATVAIDQHPPLKTNMLMFTPKGSALRVYLLNMPSEDFSRVATAKSLSIRSSGLNETFALGQMGSLLKIMNECVLDLRKVWNVSDPAGEQSLLPKRAKGNLARFVRDGDYPAQALDENLSGTVKFAVLINEKGRVADCTIVETSGVAALDAQTCAIMMERAKFEPAMGPDGKPAKDAAVSRIRWVMPH
jgi:TonB family protein